MPPRYVLRPPAPPAAAPVLDRWQQAVVDHSSGPALVLAGPGTGKTTTLVELVADRVERGGLSADSVLVLTFGRRAAAELRTRITARIGGVAAPMATTFHAFCYALLRRYSQPDAVDSPLQLLSASEQEVRIRELLAGSTQTGATWPQTLLPSLRTRGLAAEIQRLMAVSRDHGLDPGDLRAAGERHARPEWVAAGAFFSDYLDVLDAQSAMDYAELVHRAGLLAADAAVQSELRRQISLVVVDEYQDTDPAQVSLLRHLAGDGRDLVVVGDPDQAIYGFRGADVSGLLRFPEEFRRVDGWPAPTYALGATRRFGTDLARASRSVIGRSGVPGHLDRHTFATFRHPTTAGATYGDGRVRVATFASPAAEAEQIAALLRRAHLEDGVPWSQLAVVVRTWQPVLRLQRALLAADVPVEVAGNELPLRLHPAVRVLLTALRAAATAPLEPAVAEALLISPLGGMDSTSIRRLGQRLRRHQREAAGETGPARPSGLLIAAALGDPAVLAAVPGPEARLAMHLAGLLRRARDLVATGAAVDEVLWLLWSATRWPERLATAAELGGPASRAAHRDLDAVCALFAAAGRAVDRGHRLGQFLAELDDEQVPADVLTRHAARGEAVRLLTAHRAKGLEWRRVVVAGVQEGTWPDLRRRGSFLSADRLGPDGLRDAPSPARVLAEERRLFYVAVTRAREQLVVTAVASPGDEGEQPSRFLADLGVEVPPPIGRPARPLSLRGVLSELRALAETTDDAAVRAAAAARIARLAAPGPDGRPLLPEAHPDTWWGLRDPTAADAPIRPPAQALTLSASAVAAVATCPLRWFLGREAGAGRPRTAAQGFGSLLHAVAEGVATQALPVDEDALEDLLSRFWSELAFAAPWLSMRERSEAGAALRRFLCWHTAARGRRLLAVEHPFDVELTVDGETVRLRGSLDRVELDAAGRAVVIDLKTARTPASSEEVRVHPQLGVYQLAVASGALPESGHGAVPGGAELVSLRQGAPRQPDLPRVQHQDALSDDAPVRTQLALAARAVREERFPATPGPVCRSCDFRSVCPAQPQGRMLLTSTEAAS